MEAYINCLYCDKKYYVRRFRSQRFCSCSCAAKHRSERILASFWDHVDKSAGANSCWPWTDRIGRKGYGVTRFDGYTIGSHRLAWILTYGLIGDSKIFVCHHCDNPPCCNPDHLFLGTNTDNMRDAASKGRRPRGEANGGGGKLTEDDVRLIRKLYFDKKVKITQKQIALRFGVHHGTISRITLGEIWTHLL